jgi:hypothetical protein
MDSNPTTGDAVTTDTLTTVAEHLAAIANGDDDTVTTNRIVIKTAAGDVAIEHRDGALAVVPA